MARLFYPILYVSTLAVVAALWTERGDRAALLGSVGVRRAAAQSPDPFSYAPGGVNQPSMPMPGSMMQPGMVPGMMPGGRLPAGMGTTQPNLSGQVTAPVISNDAVSRPASWPSGAPSGGASVFGPPQVPSAFPTVQDNTGRPGASISQAPVSNGAPPLQTAVAAPPMNASPLGAPPPVVQSAVTPLPTTAPPPVQPLPPVQAPAAAPVAEAPPAGVPPLVPGAAMSDEELNAPAMWHDINAAKVIARVGTEVVLAGEILGPIDELLATQGQGIPEEEIDKVREQLVKRRLDQAIQTKLILGEAYRKVPAEGLKTIDAKLNELFEEKEVPKAIAKLKVKDRAELDQKLRSAGNSIEKERRNFAERQIAQDWVRQQVKADKEISHEQMLAVYLEHVTDYDFEGKVLWEQLMVRFSSYPNKEAAFQAIASAGNRVLAGEAFGDVARSMSEGSTAKDGGSFAWTTKGSLSSEAVDNALFTLPVGQLSPILEDTRGFHIIRVTQRLEAGRKPFNEVQNEIKGQIKQERVEKSIHEYVVKLQGSAKIWTIFDGPDDRQTIPGAGFYTSPTDTGLPSVVPPDRIAQPPANPLGHRYR